MWFLIGRFRCLACQALKSAKDRASRSQYRRNFGVCRTCLEGWEKAGRKCGRCKDQVTGGQALAYFRDLESFGADPLIT